MWRTITKALWGTKVSPGTINNLNKKVHDKIDFWWNWRTEETCSLYTCTGLF
jgi:hypothetical protein